MIKLIIGCYVVNLIIGGGLILYKLIERQKEKKEERQHDYKDY